MRWKIQVQVVCDGCGVEALATQEHAAFGQQGQAMRLHHPDGWTNGHALPVDAVLVDARGQTQIDPFGSASKVASAVGQPIPVLRCPACTAQNAEAGERARKLLDAVGVGRLVSP